MRGPKPQPTALKVLRGNPGKRSLNPSEPHHALLSADCPDELLDEIARAEWLRVAKPLIDCGQVTMMDRVTLIGYCQKYAQWRGLQDEARKHPFIVRSPSGHPIPNPALNMANKCFALLLKSAAELGMTPSSRSRVVAAPVQQTQVSKWAGVIA